MAKNIDDLIIQVVVDCSHCGDEHYTLQGCCDGRECGCAGQPVSMSLCTHCNPDGKKQMGDYVAGYADFIEFI